MSETDSTEHEMSSVPETLVSDDGQRAQREAENGLRQFDYAQILIDEACADSQPFALKLGHLLTLNRLAIEGVMRSAGELRSKPVFVGRHVPPDWRDVPRLMDEMLNYVNSRVDDDPIHVAAYIMWRLNWIHPFVDGNGRTSRIAAYMMLCIRLGLRLPGSNTIPEQIAESNRVQRERSRYYRGLQDADAAWKRGRIELWKLETMVTDMLVRQLQSHLVDQ